jgi:acetyl esterase/lipase
MVGLGITVASWLGLMVLFHHGRTAGETFDQALGGLAEPAGAARMPLAQLVMPFRFRRRGVKVIRNVRFESRRQDAATRCRNARAPGVNRPAIMQVHGGAWIIGDKRGKAGRSSGTRSKRLVCFNVNYRLSPAATWPDHLNDLVRPQLDREHADEYGSIRAWPLRVVGRGHSPR